MKAGDRTIPGGTGAGLADLIRQPPRRRPAGADTENPGRFRARTTGATARRAVPTPAACHRQRDCGSPPFRHRS
ncbi:hypothetical protein FAGKG844_60127 [Frankia sp. AgKG'84/4]